MLHGEEEGDASLTLTRGTESCCQSTGWEGTSIEHLLFAASYQCASLHYGT